MTDKAAPKDRMPPIPADKLTDAQKKVVAEICAGPRGRMVGPFFPLSRSPELMSRVQKLGEYLRFGGTVPATLKELAILITARQWTQQFEFQAHREIGLKAGLSAAVADAVADGRRPETMTPDETLVWEFCTELYRSSMSVSDATYERAVKRFGEQGVVDLVATCGYYTLLGMVMNVARTALPEGVEPRMRPFPR